MQQDPGCNPGWRSYATMLTFACRPGAKFRRKYFYLNIVVAAVMFVIYLKVNEGLVPWFLRPSPQLPPGGDLSMLTFFPQLQHDASKVTWACAANTRDKLKEAIKGDKHVLEGDILLHGQGTSDQRLVPVMANPPDTTSDIKFEEWIMLAKDSGHGIKLDFQTIEAVEISLQILNNLPNPVQVPLWLSGEILPGPNAADPPLDSSRFLRLCTHDFPRSTLLLGWRTGPLAESGSGNVYDWAMVKTMHDLIEKWGIRQPLVFSVQAMYLRRSLPQLKWLMEMTLGSLAVFTGDAPGITSTDLMYVRHQLPVSRVYYDLDDDLQVKFEKERDAEARVSPTHALKWGFRSDEWIVSHSGKQDEVYLGTSAVLLRHGLLLSRAHYAASPEEWLVLTGRVEFLPPEQANVAKDQEPVVGIEVFLRVMQGARPTAISGIKCTILSSGQMTISAQSIPGSDAHAEATWLEMPPCIDFTIEDYGADKVMLSVSQPTDCYDNSNAKPVMTKQVVLHTKDISLNEGQVAIRGSGEGNFIAIPHFNIEFKR